MITPAIWLLVILFAGHVVEASAQIRYFQVSEISQPCQHCQEGETRGYMLIPMGDVSESYDAGSSHYIAAWPLQLTYPGPSYQSGLPGTWMEALRTGREPNGWFYSTIEGGLGWWGDTRFATETPKFIMGGVALNFSAWANGPGAGSSDYIGEYRDWGEPGGKYGVAQLSPNLLWPPDGLNLQQGSNGGLFGYGYLPLATSNGSPGQHPGCRGCHG